MQSLPKVPLAIAAVATVGLVFGCKQRPFEISRGSSYIVGLSNDIIPATSEPEKSLKSSALQGAALIATRLSNKHVKFCSGTLVAGTGGNLRILSNHHCFAEVDEQGKAKAELISEACAFTKVYFGFLPGQTSSSFVSACQPGSLRTSFDGDLSTFELTVNPPEKYQPLEIWDESEPYDGRSAEIVHFPDVEAQMAVPPDGGLKLPTAAITTTDCTVSGEFPVSEWDLDRTLPFSVRHTCDLIHGSSGSALVDVKTGKILGVNWGGIKIAYGTEMRIDNVATRASFARAFLEGKEADQATLISSQRQSADQELAQKEVKKGSKSFTSAARKAACGVVLTAGGSSWSASLAVFVALFGLGLLPVFASSFVRRPGASRKF